MKKFFSSLWLPNILALLALGYTVYSDISSKRALVDAHLITVDERRRTALRNVRDVEKSVESLTVESAYLLDEAQGAISNNHAAQIGVITERIKAVKPRLAELRRVADGLTSDADMQTVIQVGSMADSLKDIVDEMTSQYADLRALAYERIKSKKERDEGKP